MPGCTLYTDLWRTTVLTSIGGEAIWNTELPGEPAFLGRSFYQQVFVVDSGVPGLGAVMSNAAEGVIGSPGAPVARIVFPPPSSVTDEDTILYEFTIEDPTTYSQPWGGQIPFNRFDDLVYEYSCHEGNYALSAVLSGARYQERQAGRD